MGLTPFTYPYKDGFAAVVFGGKIGFIDRSGQLVIEPELESDSSYGAYFSSGIAAVGSTSRRYYIEQSGDRLIDNELEYCGDFVGPYAIVGLDDDSQSYYRLIQKSGEVVTWFPEMYEPPDCIGLDEQWDWGLFPCSVQVGDEIRIGWLNWRGQVQFSPMYSWMTNFYQSVAGYCPDKDNFNSPYGLVRRCGEIVLPPTYYRLGGFVEGLPAAADSAGRVGFIDIEGSWVVQPVYRQACGFSCGLACVTFGEGPYVGRKGFISKSGEVVVDPTFRHEGTYVDGFVIMENDDGKQVVLNTVGEVVWSE